MENSKKIGALEKFNYMIGGIGGVAAQVIISSFLLIFYTDVCGMNPAAVATLFLITRILDAVNNPITGYIIDHLPKSKLGRFRLTFIIGSIFFALNLALVFLGPLFASGGKLVIAYISYILIGITMDFSEIPRTSLLAVMTDDVKDRGSLCSLKAFSNLMGGMLVSIVVPMLIQKAPTPAQGYIWVIVGIVLLMILLNIISGFGVKERIGVIEEVEKYKVKELLKIFTVVPIIIVYMCLLLNVIYVSMNGATMTYFAKYVLKDFSVIAITSLIGLAGQIPSMMIGGFLGAKLGKKQTFAITIVLTGVFILIRYFNPTNLILLYASTLLIGLVGGALGVMGSVFQADLVEVAEYYTGVRAEGAVSALASSTMKLGGAIAAAVPGYILALAHYDSKAAAASESYIPQQSVIDGIMFMNLALPAIICFASGLLMWFGYHINNEKHKEMVTELAKRREMKQKEAGNTIDAKAV